MMTKKKPANPDKLKKPKRTLTHGWISKLTIEVQDVILQSIRLGMPFTHAALAAGTTYQNFNFWCRMGSRSEKEPYRSFYVAVKKAKSEGMRANLKIIQFSAAGGSVTFSKTTTRDDGTKIVEERKTPSDWNAAAWLLKHTHPEHFSGETIESKQILAELKALRRAMENDNADKNDASGEKEPRKKIRNDDPGSDPTGG